MENIQALRCQRIPGSFVHHGCGLSFICPCGCGGESYLRRAPVCCGPSWDFCGSLDRPTLSPSIYNVAMPCQWHGFLRGGEWHPC